jgi:hypothetical protein
MRILFHSGADDRDWTFAQSPDRQRGWSEPDSTRAFFITQYNANAQSSGGAHIGKVCVRVFIEVSVRACCECPEPGPAVRMERTRRQEGFFRITQYNADAHNTHAHSPLWIHVRKLYPYEHLRRTEHRQIWRFSKSPLASRRRRERRLPLNAYAGKSRNISRKRCEHHNLNPGG